MYKFIHLDILQIRFRYLHSFIAQNFKMMKNKTIILISLMTLTFSTEARQQTEYFIDPRDDKSYAIVAIGKFHWFADNLNWEINGSYCYENEDKNCETYGRLYKWEIALNACPQGWHLSTDYEWQALELAVGMEFQELAFRSNRGKDEGLKLKVGGSIGFNAKYAGWRRKDGTYRAMGDNAAFWTSTDADLAHAWHRDINTGDEFVYRSRVYKPYAMSVRCVKNHLVADEPEEN